MMVVIVVMVMTIWLRPGVCVHIRVTLLRTAFPFCHPAKAARTNSASPCPSPVCFPPGVIIYFVEADVSATPLRDAPFDAAFSRFGVMFFDDTAAAFAKIRAAMTPNGRVVFICWRTFAENGWSHAPLAALQPILKTPITPADPDAPGPFQLQDPEKIKSMLAASGWRDVSITPWGGDVLVGGGGDAESAAAFLLKIGPCARAITDQQLDAAQAQLLLTDFLRKRETPAGVALPAACWIVRAVA